MKYINNNKKNQNLKKIILKLNKNKIQIKNNKIKKKII